MKSVTTELFSSIIKKNYIEALKCAITAKIDITLVNAEGKTPLMLAAEMGKLEIVDLLLRNGAVMQIYKGMAQDFYRQIYDDVDQQSKQNLEEGKLAIGKVQQAINLAQQYKNDEIVTKINNAIEINKKLLAECCHNEYLNEFTLPSIDKVKSLLEQGAYINITDNFQRSPLMLIIDQLPDYNRDPEKYKTIFKIAECLLKWGADVNAQDIVKSTPLINAVAKTSDPNIVKLLIDNGADINHNDEIKCNALSLAMAHCKDQIVQVLLANNADYYDENNQLILIEAIKNRCKNLLMTTAQIKTIEYYIDKAQQDNMLDRFYNDIKGRKQEIEATAGIAFNSDSIEQEQSILDEVLQMISNKKQGMQLSDVGIYGVNHQLAMK